MIAAQTCNNNVYVYLYWLKSRVFANGPGDRGSIPAIVILEPKKCYLMPPFLTLCKGCILAVKSPPTSQPSFYAFGFS